MNIPYILQYILEAKKVVLVALSELFLVPFRLFVTRLGGLLRKPVFRSLAALEVAQVKHQRFAGLPLRSGARGKSPNSSRVESAARAAAVGCSTQRSTR